uniref:Solute carrier family 26 member 3 n=1 Tax=Sinocyclocheilus grahami TaxID=75366 RepID=A0A672NP69_SINGR
KTNDNPLINKPDYIKHSRSLSLLSIIGWMKNYNIKEWLLGEIVSGISTGLVAVLQGLAFSLLASLLPGYGLYTGTSRHLSVGFPQSVMIWGAMSSAGVGPLCFLKYASSNSSLLIRITNTYVADLVTSIVIMALVLIVKEINDRFKSKLPVPIPIEVIVTVIACVVSYALNFQERFDVVVVGEMVNCAMEAIPMAIVGFAVAFSVAKVYSVKHDYTIDGNQELIAFGVSNMFGASFRSFAASTALSRTAIQESTGGKTQMIVIVAIGFLLEPLPRSVLGALVLINLKGMLMQFRELPFLWKNNCPCVLASLFLGLDLGLAVGLGAELFTVVLRTQFPRGSLLANITGTDIYRDRKDYMKIFNLLLLKKRNKALQKIRKMLRNGELEFGHPWFIRIEVDVYIVLCDVYIMEKLQRCSLFDDEIKTSIFYPTLHDAMLHILEMHPDHGELEKVRYLVDQSKSGRA